MAMIIDAFVSMFAENVVELAKEDIVMLLGMENELESLVRRLDEIKIVVMEAERKSLENNPIINNWLKDLREVLYDADDLIDEIRINGVKRRRLSAQPQQSSTIFSKIHSAISSSFRSLGEVALRHEFGRRITEINTTLEEIYKKSSRFQLPEGSSSGRNTWRENKMILTTSPVVVDSDIIGLENDTDKLVGNLMEGNKQRIGVFAIWGMGGIGKTTLAQKIYNNERIKGHFPIRMWVCVSQNIAEIDLLKEIIRQAGGSCGESQTRAELDLKLKDVVRGKRFFLVLDDIWDEKVWENLLRSVLQSGHTDSRVLITSRKKEIGLAMGAVYLHKVELPSNQDGWLILQNKALRGSSVKEIEELCCVGVEIVTKCNNLPLAIQTIGGVLIKKERKREAWERILASPAWSFTTLPEEILPALYLSYEDLASQHKQCFLYCSLFPEDYQFWQPSLVQLWVAEGFVNAHGGLTAAEVANEVYKDLISMSLLQVVPSCTNMDVCKVHDLLRLLAIFVAKRDNQSRILQGLSVTFATTRRLSIINKGISEIFYEIKRQKCLRTLILQNNPMIVSIPEDLFEKLRRLRVLDVSGTKIEKLPESVKNLLHLRLLKLCFNVRLGELPESVKYLQNLLILNVYGCENLQKLPSDIVHLYNLRYLITKGTQVGYLPIGIGNLEHLEELLEFVVGDERGSEGQLGASIKELKSLSSLRALIIAKLERVENKTDAQEASLSKKPKLEVLWLGCSSGLHFEEGKVDTIKEVFEALTPPPCLERLGIESFFGCEFPSWISGSFLSNLTWLKLGDCMLCTKLPPLGQLRKLRYLEIRDASSVKSIGAEFLGGLGAFPQLETLVIEVMSNCEEWVGLEDGDLPRLEKMTLFDCPKLKYLPDGLHHATSLTELRLERVVSLQSIKNLPPSITNLWIWNNPMLECVSNLPALDYISIRDCPAFKEMENLDALRSLRLDDGNMDVLPKWLGTMTTLQQLTIYGNTNLINRCAVDKEDWDQIRHIPQLYICSPVKSKELNPRYDERVPCAAIAWAESRRTRISRGVEHGSRTRIGHQWPNHPFASQ